MTSDKCPTCDGSGCVTAAGSLTEPHTKRDGPLDAVRRQAMEVADQAGYCFQGNCRDEACEPSRRLFDALDAAEAEWRAEREHAEWQLADCFGAIIDAANHRNGWRNSAQLLRRRLQSARESAEIARAAEEEWRNAYQAERANREDDAFEAAMQLDAAIGEVDDE